MPEKKIEALIKGMLMEESNVNSILRLLPVAGLGYLGYQSGQDFGNGLVANSGFTDAIINPVAHDLGFGEEVPSVKQEIQKFVTPGQDGSWRNVGKALGHQSSLEGRFLPPENREQAKATFKIMGALAGAGLGKTASSLIPKQKNTIK